MDVESRFQLSLLQAYERSIFKQQAHGVYVDFDASFHCAMALGKPSHLLFLDDLGRYEKKAAFQQFNKAVTIHYLHRKCDLQELETALAKRKWEVEVCSMGMCDGDHDALNTKLGLAAHLLLPTKGLLFLTVKSPATISPSQLHKITAEHGFVRALSHTTSFSLTDILPDWMETPDSRVIYMTQEEGKDPSVYNTVRDYHERHSSETFYCCLYKRVGLPCRAAPSPASASSKPAACPSSSPPE